MMRFSIMNMLRKNQKLLACNPDSLLGSVFTAAQLGLRVGYGALNEAWIIPYAGEATFQIGYMGFVALMDRTNLYKRIAGDSVKPGDVFEYEKGSTYLFRHKKQCFDPKAQPEYYYGEYQTIHGGGDYKILSRAEVLDHAQRKSKSFQRGEGPWITDFDAMAIKTALKEVCKRASKGTELAPSLRIARAFDVDQAIVRVSKDQPDPTQIILEHTHDMPVEKNERGETAVQAGIRQEKETAEQQERRGLVSDIQTRIRDMHRKGMKRAEFEKLIGCKLEAIEHLELSRLYAVVDVLG